MELSGVFSIECTTCGSRLKVRDRSLVGQILACPKCGSMVQITAPPNSGDQDDQATPHPHAPAGGNDAPAGGEDSRIRVGPDGTVDSQAITRDSITHDDLAPASAVAPSGAAAAGDSAAFQAAGVPPAADPSDAHSEQASRWSAAAFAQSDRSHRRRQIGLITALSTVALATSLLAFILFVRWWQSESDSPPPLADQTQATATAPIDRADQPTDPAAEPTDQADKPTDQGNQPTDSAAEPTEQAAEPTDQTAEPSPGEDAEPAAEPDPPSEPAPTEQPPTEQPTTAEDIAASLLADPILDMADDAADSDQPQGAANAGPSNTDEANAEASTEMPAAMRRWVQVLDLDGPAEQDDQAAPPTIDQVELDLPAAAQADVEAIDDIDVSLGLARRMAFDRRPAPLIRWLHLLAQLSGVPVGVDMVALDAARIDPLTSVTPPPGWSTAGEVLEHLCRQAGCRLTATDSAVLVDVAPERITAAIADALRVDDLLEPDVGDAETLPAIVARVAGIAEVQIGAEGRLTWPDATASQQWLAALTLEGTRLARGLPPRLPRQSTARYLVRGSDAEWPLVSEGVSLRPVDQPQPTLDLIVRLARANDAFPFINWTDALAGGFSPATDSMPWLKDVTAGEVLEDMLQPHGLKAYQTGDARWWIGSAASYDRSELLAVVPVDASQADGILTRLATSVGMEADQITAAVDPVSSRLIVRGPRFIIRQLPKVISPQLVSR